MKEEELIKEYIEATAMRAKFAARCNNSFFTHSNYEEGYAYWKSKQEALYILIGHYIP